MASAKGGSSTQQGIGAEGYRTTPGRGAKGTGKKYQNEINEALGITRTRGRATTITRGRA